MTEAGATVTTSVPGVRCVECGYPAAGERPRCPRCHGRVAPAGFGPAGTVWSSTVVRIPVPGREPPYALAYVDLDDGPRVLAVTTGESRLPVGARVTVTSVDDEGMVHVEPAG